MSSFLELTIIISRKNGQMSRINVMDLTIKSMVQVRAVFEAIRSQSPDMNSIIEEIYSHDGGCEVPVSTISLMELDDNLRRINGIEVDESTYITVKTAKFLLGENFLSDYDVELSLSLN